ncbi:glycine--tRNA ligase subunit beta [Achromobacter sp. F4_2707]|uniref:glycine--tRNA ligase subunit beta n=1 Tax=Achromobacter sp. F4_2707 TaxID=3114286 RepID=UPI0039C6797D
MASQPQTRPLLVELLTEELPPKALQRLGQSFAETLRTTLEQHHLLADGCTVRPLATPRRLAAVFDAVLGQAPEQHYTEKLMPVKIGLTADREMTPALVKKLQAKGLESLGVDDLIIESDGKQDTLYARGVAAGETLQAGLQKALDQAITQLPIPKVMRYQLADGVSSVRFVRPAHRLIALWGSDVVPVEALGLQAGRTTEGHRFMSEGVLEITTAEGYENQLLEEGKVVAGFETRRADILQQLQKQADTRGATLGNDPEVEALLDEVTALVEHPTVYTGEFDPDFLRVPPECLILTMRLNQKYFPLFEPDTGKLTHRFLIVSNMRVANPSHIIEGNQRVVRPRLADAQFFFDTDRSMRLEERVAQLASSVYHNKLGSVLQRVERIRRIAVHIATQLGADAAAADRAALLAKADLNSNMVGEFPELQGIMGAYYAEGDGEAPEVVEAIRNQYRIRLEAPVTTSSQVAAALFMADRLEVLVGIWGIGLVPTGERDPYGLRRAALGLISAYEQLAAGGLLTLNDHQTLRLDDLLAFTASTFEPGTLAEGTAQAVAGFIYERYRNQLAGHDRNVVDAVLSITPPLHQVLGRIQACAAFAQRPEADSLAAANKRITNLLKKADSDLGTVDSALYTEAAEKALAACIEELSPVARQQFEAGDFSASLATLAGSRAAVDAFFNDVMIMVDDLAVRRNRLALLEMLHRNMNQVADISRLA